MRGYTPTPDFYDEYIAHYGIPGMKWKNHIYKTLQGKYIGAKFAARKKLQALDKQYGLSRKIKRAKRNAGLALKNAKMRTVNGISTRGLRSEAKYLGTKAKNAAKKAKKSLTNAKMRTVNGLSIQGAKSQAKYLGTKYKNKAKKGLTNLKTRTVNGITTQSVRSEAKYLGTKAKNAAKRTKNKTTSYAKSKTQKLHAAYDTRYGKSASKGDSRYRNNGNLSDKGYSSADSGQRSKANLSSKGYSKADSGKRKKLRNTSALRKDSRYRTGGMGSKSAMRKDSRYRKSSAMKGDRRYRKHG